VASGFLVLADGRCFAPNWKDYDAVLKAVADQLNGSQPALVFRNWLLSLLPGPTDVAELGYGPWLRIADDMLVDRFLDIRELTPENQKMFHEAARKSGQRALSSEALDWPDWLKSALVDLADMVERADRGEPPLSRSMWMDVVPSKCRKIGPGW
jgi:hypothetical protein